MHGSFQNSVTAPSSFSLFTCHCSLFLFLPPHHISFWLPPCPLFSNAFFSSWLSSVFCLFVCLFVLVFYFFNFKIFNSYMRSQTRTPSHLPPHNISLGYPHAPAPSMLYPASNIDWRFNSYMIVYMLECHSPKSSHPLPLPLSPKVHYTHLCLFPCLAYRVVIAIFLNSIYMC